MARDAGAQGASRRHMVHSHLADPFPLTGPFPLTCPFLPQCRGCSACARLDAGEALIGDRDGQRRERKGLHAVRPSHTRTHKRTHNTHAHVGHSHALRQHDSRVPHPAPPRGLPHPFAICIVVCVPTRMPAGSLTHSGVLRTTATGGRPRGRRRTSATSRRRSTAGRRRRAESSRGGASRRAGGQRRAGCE